MRTAKGSNRFVLIFPRAGFVIKLPKPRIGTYYRNLKSIAFSDHKKFLRKSLKRAIKVFPYLIREMKKDFVISVRTNKNEFDLYLKTHHILLMPTYCSVFGWLNIQKYGGPLVVDKKQFYKLFFLKIFEVIPSEDAVFVSYEVHHLGTPKNFGYDLGVVKLFDYGSQAMEDVIVKYGNQIHDILNK